MSAPAHSMRRNDILDDAVGEPARPTVSHRPRPKHLWWWSVLLVVPYLLLGLSWVFSNPAGAAPDEADHLVKALGVARFDIGTKYLGPPAGPKKGQSRNASLARVVTIPRALDPEGFRCFAFKSTQSAACLPPSVPGVTGTVDRFTPMGSYPPFLYLPVGVAAHLADNPTRAFHLGRLAALAMSCALLLIGVAYLLRWVGAGAVVGLVVAITPMAAFCFSILSTSGVEIAGAVAVATVAGVALVRPESILSRSAHLTLLAAGCTLILSRQMGVVACGLLVLATLFAAGPSVLLRLLKEHRASFVVTAVAMLGSVAAVTWWERTFDHPNQLGHPLEPGAWPAFLQQFPAVLETGVGKFGWLDTPLPTWAIIVWTVTAVTLVGAALMLGTWRSRVVVLALLAVALVISYTTYAVVFYPITAFLQGRDVLSLVIGVPVIAGVVLSTRLAALGLWRELRQFVFVACSLIAVVEFTAIYANGHRYASGIDSSWWYVPLAQWSPPRGWWLWLAIAAVGATALAIMPALALRRFGAADGPPQERMARPDLGPMEEAPHVAH